MLIVPQHQYTQNVLSSIRHNIYTYLQIVNIINVMWLVTIHLHTHTHTFSLAHTHTHRECFTHSSIHTSIQPFIHRYILLVFYCRLNSLEFKPAAIQGPLWTNGGVLWEPIIHRLLLHVYFHLSRDLAIRCIHSANIVE